MAFRFRKSFRVAPGIKLNLSRSGVSTTLGGRGFSVNTGRRGTYVNAGIPRSGISTRSRLGGRGGGRAAGAGGGGNPPAAGCGGCGGLMLLLLVFAGFCGSLLGGGSGRRGDGSTLLTTDTGYSAPREVRATLYTHGRMNIRSGAGTGFAVVRTVSRGERVEVGPGDEKGWAPVYAGYGEPVGCVYRASPNLRTYAPPAPSPRRTRTERRPRTHPAGASAICRDGTYSYSAHRRGTCSWHGGVAQWL